MLSYRHAFHAGNHADVLKHFIEVQLLRYLTQKDKPFWYIDTHAGAGCYSLDTGYATQNAEYESGIARLWNRDDLPAPLAEFVELVKHLNPDGEMKLYPGSPLLALELIREQDRLRLYELHPSDYEILHENFATYGNRVLLQKADGFGALKALLPPPPRRALVLIDPPYEDKQDYQRVVSALQEGLKRFANGVYAVWYPQLQRIESRQLPEQLKQLPVKSWLHVSLSVQTPSDEGFGMHGNGIEEARAEGKRRAVIEAKFASLITANLKYCKASAEKTRNDYVKFVQDSVLIENEAALSRYNEKSALIKPAKFYIPKATISETTEMLEAAQAECQQIYDMQLKSSK